MKNPIVPRPDADEYFEYYAGYVSKVPGSDLIRALADRRGFVERTYTAISEDQSRFRYAEDKWSIRELLGHLIDTERVMAFRALAFARGTGEPLPGMDQDDYIRNADFDSCDIKDLTAEFLALRDANIVMFANMPDAAWDRRGVASGYEFTVRALGYIVAGHEIHHTDILLDRYLAK